jgi:hypothetical protein
MRAHEDREPSFPIRPEDVDAELRPVTHGDVAVETDARRGGGDRDLRPDPIRGRDRFGRRAGDGLGEPERGLLGVGATWRLG